MTRTYNFGNGIRFAGDGFVEVLAATQSPGPGGTEWFQGTADAVRQYSWLFADIKNKDIEDVLILSGDHLYRMDYMAFIARHRETNADITVSALPMDPGRASDFGLMKIDAAGRITGFAEKPKGDALKAWAVDTTVLGLTREEAQEKPYIASMGIYVFKKKVLLELLNKAYPKANDFGSEIIPAAASSLNVQARAVRRGAARRARARERESLSARASARATLNRRTCSTTTGRTSVRSAPSSTPTWRWRSSRRSSSSTTR